MREGTRVIIMIGTVLGWVSFIQSMPAFLPTIAHVLATRGIWLLLWALVASVWCIYLATRVRYHKLNYEFIQQCRVEEERERQGQRRSRAITIDDLNDLRQTCNYLLDKVRDIAPLEVKS